MGAVLYSGIWHARCGRRPILDDHVLLHDVALPCKPMYLSVPRMGLWPDCGVDRHVCRLEPARDHLHAALPLAPLAESPRHRLIVALEMLVILRMRPVTTPGKSMLCK